MIVILNHLITMVANIKNEKNNLTYTTTTQKLNINNIIWNTNTRKDWISLTLTQSNPAIKQHKDIVKLVQWYQHQTFVLQYFQHNIPQGLRNVWNSVKQRISLYDYWSSDHQPTKQPTTQWPKNHLSITVIELLYVLLHKLNKSCSIGLWVHWTNSTSIFPQSLYEYRNNIQTHNKQSIKHCQ